MIDSAGGAHGDVAREFHEGTKHSPEGIRRRGWSLDWENEPHPFKVYEGIERLDLPRDGRALDAPLIPSLWGRSVTDATTEVDIALLGKLLFLCGGVHRRRRLGSGGEIAFRTYASAGALYPNELYVVAGEVAGLPPGVYHFDADAFTLGVLRRGDHRAVLARAAADPALEPTPLVLAFSGIPWRTCWKYTERGYRHLFWDAGMMAANLMAASSGVGLSTRVILGFIDHEVAALIGVDGVREFPLFLAAIGPRSGTETGEAPSGNARVQEPVRASVRPLSRREIRFRGVEAVHRAGELRDGEELRAWRQLVGGAAQEVGDPRAASHAGGAGIEEVIRRRGSARRFGSGAIPAQAISTILHAAAAPFPVDIGDGRLGMITPFLIVSAVEGIQPGSYVLDDGELRSIDRGNFRSDAAFLCLEQDLAGHAAATIFLMADLARILTEFGDRGYRTAQLAAGIAGGRAYLAAYAHRVGATGLTFYDDEVRAFFGPEAGDKECLLVVAIGESPRLGPAAG